MPQPKVSVIIPVYNVADFLRQCLDSVMNQSLEEIEIICVDDGSNDGSFSILEEYANHDKRFIVLTQENSGAGAARNKGLAIAKGEYLSFLDADDFFELDMLEKAYLKCKEDDADIGVFEADFYDNSTGEYKPCNWAVKKKLLPPSVPFSHTDFLDNTFRVFIGWAWDKLFKTSFVTTHSLQFQEQRTTNDMYFVFIAIVKAERITLIPEVLAHQRRNLSTSLSVTREKSWTCFHEALIAIKDEITRMGIFESLEPAYSNYSLSAALWNLNSITGPTYEKLYNKLRDEWFSEFGIDKHPAEYFQNKREYAQYLMIRDMSCTTYLQSRLQQADEERNSLRIDLQEANGELNRLRKIKLPSQEGKSSFAKKPSLCKLTRAITYFPRKIARFIRRAIK